MIWERSITILGAPNSDTGALSPQSLDRTTRAFALWQANPEAVLLLTGGFGPHFNRTEFPHTYYVRKRLLELGVPATSIVAELPSKNTYEDIVLLKDTLSVHARPDGAHSVVTSTFHSRRVELLLERIFKGSMKVNVVGAVDSLSADDLRMAEQHESRAIQAILGIPR